MSRFDELVVTPFRADLAEWRAQGWDASRPGRLASVGLTLRFSGLRATLLHRLAFWAHETHIRGVPAVLSQLNLTLHAFDIPASVAIGGGLYMPHCVGSVVFAHSIGEHVTLQGGITIGLKKRAEFPVIGDGVSVGAGARILGGVRIGEGAVIAANAVVLEDVAPCATMAGVPARAIGRALPE